MGTMRINHCDTTTSSQVTQPCSPHCTFFPADDLYTTFALNHAHIAQIWVFFFPLTGPGSPGTPGVHALQQPIKKKEHPHKITLCIHYLLTVKESKLIKVTARLNEKILEFKKLKLSIASDQNLFCEVALRAVDG